MSVKQLFVDQQVEYLLPTAVGASVGSVIELSAPGVLSFGSGAAPASSTTANYTFTVAGGVPSATIPILFYNEAGVTYAFCQGGVLASATASNVGPGNALFILSGTPSTQLANMLPPSGTTARTGSAFICNGSGETWLGDMSVDYNGLFAFNCENGVTFVNGDAYQLGISTSIGLTSYCLGSWASAV